MLKSHFIYFIIFKIGLILNVKRIKVIFLKSKRFKNLTLFKIKKKINQILYNKSKFTYLEGNINIFSSIRSN